MQQFTVPQFIDVEDKVIGPLSVRQFVILLVVGGVCVLNYRLFYFTMFLILSFFEIVIGLTFAFVKINGAHFHLFLVNLVQTLVRPKIRVWHTYVPASKKIKAKKEIDVFNEEKQPRKFSSTHLNQLALIVDTRGYYKGDEQEENLIKQDKTLKDLIESK